MRKKLLIFLIIILFFILGGVSFFWWQRNQRKKAQETVSVPTTVKKVNQLEISKRPYVALLPYPNSARCDGVEMLIENLKNGETLAEYELEYTAGPLIQGVFGRRDLTEAGAEHQPLEFGSCSKGKCKCDKEITGGSLTLNFSLPDDEYSLKSDFSLQTVEKGQEEITSTDARLLIDVNSALPDNTQVIVMKTMGLPGEINGEVLAGPYGIFTPRNIKLKKAIEVSLQTKDEGKLMFWNGKAWQELDVEASDGKLTSTISETGVIALVR